MHNSNGAYGDHNNIHHGRLHKAHPGIDNTQNTCRHKENTDHPPNAALSGNVLGDDLVGLERALSARELGSMTQIDR